MAYNIETYRFSLPQQDDTSSFPTITPYIEQIKWASLYSHDVILHGNQRNHIAFTFDDGPDDVWTPHILDILWQYQINATFMCVGRQVRQNPEILRRIFREGHEIGNHSWSHLDLTSIPIRQVTTEIKYTSAEISGLVGKPPCLFRPPYGILNADVIQQAISLGNKIVLWNVNSLDWAGLNSTQIAANILSHAEPGSIVLQHCAGKYGINPLYTALSLPFVIESLQSEGFHFVTVSELLSAP